MKYTILFSVVIPFPMVLYMGWNLLLLIRCLMLYNPNLWMLWRRTSIQLSYFVGKFLTSSPWILQKVRYLTILYHYLHVVYIIMYYINLSDLKVPILLSVQSINLFWWPWCSSPLVPPWLVPSVAGTLPSKAWENKKKSPSILFHWELHWPLGHTFRFHAKYQSVEFLGVHFF